MEEYVKYIIISVLILSIDGIWIYTNYGLYSDSIKAVQKSEAELNWYYAVIAYIFVLFATLYVAIPFTKFHLERKDQVPERLYKSLVYGGTVGLAIHGIYNFTKMAIYKNYSIKIALLDTVWGAILYTFVIFIYTLL